MGEGGGLGGEWDCLGGRTRLRHGRPHISTLGLGKGKLTLRFPRASRSSSRSLPSSGTGPGRPVASNLLALKSHPHGHTFDAAKPIQITLIVRLIHDDLLLRRSAALTHAAVIVPRRTPALCRRLTRATRLHPKLIHPKLGHTQLLLLRQSQRLLHSLPHHSFTPARHFTRRRRRGRRADAET